MGIESPFGGNPRFLGENADEFQGPFAYDPKMARKEESEAKKAQRQFESQKQGSYKSGLQEGYDALDISTHEDAFTKAPVPNYSNGQIERKSEQQVVNNFPNPGGEKVEATLSINKNGIPKRSKKKPSKIIAGGPSLTSSDGVLDPRLAKDGLYETYDDPSQEDGKGYKHIGNFDSFLNADDQDVRQKARVGSIAQNSSARKAVIEDIRVQKEEITGKLAELLASKNSSMDGNVMYDGNKISLADADIEIGNLQKKRAELIQQKAKSDALFGSGRAGDDLRYATQKALSEGRNPEEDPIIKSLRKSYETLGREVDKLDLTMPDDVAQNPIAKKQFYENKGLEMEAKDRANLIKGNFDAQTAKTDLENTEAARNHFFATAPFETLRSQTDALVEDTNKMREENAKNWENMSERDRQLFVERFKGRQESISRAKEQLSKMVPDVNKSAEETNARFNANQELQKKAVENHNLQIEKLNNEMKIKADAVHQRAVAANDKYRVEQQQKFEGLNTELQKAVLSKKDKDITDITKKMVDQGMLSEERVKQAVVEYKKAVNSNDKQSDFVDALGSVLRASMVASQETARGAYSIAANSLRAMINGKDPMPDMAPQGLQAVTSVLGKASLLANPVKGVQDAISAAGQRVGNKILEFGIRHSSKIKSLAEVTADVLEASAQAAKENKDAINKTMYVDPSFEAGITGQVLKTLGESPWTMAPYAFGEIGIPIAGALNVSRLYSEAREDQDQSYQAKLQEFKSGKIKEEPQAMTEEEAHRSALQYALPAGMIDTIADKIGFDLLKGGFKVGGKLAPKTLGEFFEATAKSLARDGEQALPLYMSAPLGGAVESISETSQQVILNGLAQQYKNWDPKREWTQELAQSAIVGGLAGILFPVMGHVSGGVYKKYVTLPQMALDNAGLDEVANQFRSHSQDVEVGGWAKFAQAIMPESAEPAQALGAKVLNTPESQLRGTGVKWVIANGIKIDARINQLQAEIDSLPPSEGKSQRQERNHLLMMRANLVSALQNDANTRSQLWKEISELPNEPLRKGEQNLHDLALVVAKFSMGAPLTEEEMKMKANGMPIIQNAQLVQMKLALQNRDPAREDGNKAVSPAFMRLIAGKLPTLEAVIESNQALLEGTPGVADEGAVPPKLSEAPSKEQIIAERKAVGEEYDKANQPTRAPSETTKTAQPSPSMPTWNVAWKRGKASGTSQVSAPTSGQAKLEALKQLKAENLPGQISIGPAEQAEQQDLIPSEQQPLINRAKELARRGSPISVNRYLRRLKGNTPEEKLADAKQRLTAFAMGMKSKYGQTVRFSENKSLTMPIFANQSEDGNVTININPDFFLKNDPEHNNRSFAEEIFHAADFIASNLEAEKAGRTDKHTFWRERRSSLYSKLKEIGKTNEDVAKAIIYSASLYVDEGPLRGKLFDKEGQNGGLSVEDTIGLIDAEQSFNDAAFMAELLRQLNSPRTTEGRVEFGRARNDAKRGKYASLKEAISVVTNYLKQVYRAIKGIRDGLKDNPEVAQELDATLQSIRDVLNEKDTEEPPLDSGLVKKLKDRGLTTAEINKMTPEEAQNRANTPIQGPAQGLDPERLKNQKSNNVRGTKYGGVKFDYVVVPRGKLNNMAGTELQPRNRSGDPDYTKEALERANELDPNKLLQGNELDTGAPTVIASGDNPYSINKDGFDIIAGHGRNESIGLAPDERRQAYIDEMRRMYPELNDEINAILESGEMPVLVRKINWDATKDSSLGTPTQQLRRIARDANLGTGNSNQTEVSLSDAMEVKDDVTLSAPPEADGSLLDPAGNPLGDREVLDKWFKIFGSPREYKSGNGYTKSFEDRVRNAIVAYTFAPVNENGQIKLDKDTFNLINTLVSENVAKEANLSSLRDGLHKAAPSLFRVRQKFQELENKLPQEAKDSNPITNIQKALVAYLGYRSEQINAGLKVSDIEFDKFVNQGQLFGEVITPNQAMILAPMVQKNGENGLLEAGQGALAPIASIKDAHSIKDSPDRIAAYLSAYANAIADAYSEYGADAVFPGMERKLTTEENASIIKGALEMAGAIYPKGQRAPEPQMPNTASNKSLGAKSIEAVKVAKEFVSYWSGVVSESQKHAKDFGNTFDEASLMERPVYGKDARDKNMANFVSAVAKVMGGRDFMRPDLVTDKDEIKEPQLSKSADESGGLAFISNKEDFDKANYLADYFGIKGKTTLGDILNRAKALGRDNNQNLGAKSLPSISPVRELRKLTNDLKNGKITELDLAVKVGQLVSDIEDQRDQRMVEKIFKERVRGPDFVEQKLLEAKRNGSLSVGQVEMARFLLRENPNLAEGLGISIRGAKEQEDIGGIYNPFNRVMTLIKDRGNESVAVHEILHHAERMMPKDVQEGIKVEWSKAYSKAIQDATAKNDTKRIELLTEMFTSLIGDQAPSESVMKAFDDNSLSRDDYQLVNPSEFWAVNASRIVADRSQTMGWVEKARQWLKEFYQLAKGAIGLQSDSPILKGLAEVIQSEGYFQSKGMLSGGLKSLASKFTDEQLFNNDENAETEQEVGATEESVKNAGIVRNIIAPPEKVKRGSSNGEKNERTQPGGKLINSFVRSSIAERFYIRGYSQDELRELAYDKIMDLLSKSPAGQKIAKQYLSANSEFLNDNLINAKGGAEISERKEGQMELVKTLVARAKSEGNATPTGADLMAFMTAEEKAKGFTETEIESARSERHLFNYVLRSLTNMVAKMTGNEESEGKIIAQSQIENRYNNLSPEADTEEMAENMYGNQAGVETTISNIPLEEVYENIERSLQNTTPERIMRSILGNLGGKDGPMDLHARGLSFSQIADELNLTGTQRDDAKVWRSIQEGYQRMQVALDAIRKRKSELESLRNPTEEDEATLDEINEYLGGFSKKDLEAINAKAKEKEEFQKALDESRLEKGESVQQSLFAKVPDARIVTKYYELQDKIRAGEVTPRELDMYDKIESMAIKYKWPGVPVQTRLFELASIMRRTKDSNTQTDLNVKQMELMLDDDTLSGLNGNLKAKTIARMSEDQLLNELEGDWLTEEELQQAMADEEAGKSRGLADYGESENASAGVRASQEATPRPAVKKLEDTARGSDSISDRDILARMREEGVQLSDEETFAARRVSNKLWDEAIESGDETQINRAFLVTRDYIRSGTEQARGLAARRGRSQEDAHRDAILSPILPTENELKKEAATQAVKARREASSKRAQVEDAKSKLSKQDQQRPDWKEWFDTQEKEIAEHKKTIADGGRSKAEEVVVDKKRKKAEEALAVTGRNLATLETENTIHKLRTGETMNQILGKIGDPILREAVRMYTQGMAVKDIEKTLGKKGLKNDINKAIVNGLQPEMDRRFQRLYDEVAEKGLTKKQLIARLKKLSNGQSLLAKGMDNQDDGSPLTQEEARQITQEMFGLTTEGLNREKSEQLFNYKDQVQVSKIQSLITEGVDGPASWGKIASDVFASFIFSGAPSLVANVGLTTIAWASVPAHLFAEAITSRMKGDVKMAYGDEIIGTPYKNIGEAVSGGITEAKSALASIKIGALNAAWAKACDAFKNEFSSFGEDQGMANQGLTERESGIITKSIPGFTGKVVRAGINLLLSGDEFTKNFRANMYVGAFAYRVGKAKGLSGTDLTDFVENQIADKSSIAWDLAVKRTLRDTFGQNLASEENVSRKTLGKTRSIGEGFGIVPQAARNINAGIAKMAQQASQTDGIGNITIGGRSFSPAEFALRFAQSFFILIKSPYNIARAAAAYSPLAGLNVIARNAAGTRTTIDPETGKTIKYMQAEDYEASVQRHTEAMLGMMGMAALWSAFEGDDDDDEKRVFGLSWMPKILITGSSDKGPKTRYGNQATTITVGGYSFPYGRYEPLSGLAYLADLAREAKQIQKGRGSAGARVQQWASDFISYPFSKTFSKSWRDLAKFASVKGVPEVMQNRIASVVVPNFFRRLFEPGAVTAGEEEWDSERLSGWSWNEMGGWINATLPGLPSMLSEAGVKGVASEGLPPRSLADLSVKKRNVAVSETIAKRILPDRAARLIGGITRGLVPEGGFYEAPAKTRLEKFISAYNARYPQTSYNPKPPNKFVQIKDKNGISKNEQMTPREYKMMLEMASKLGTARINSVLSDENIANPTENVRKLVDKIREDAVSSAREAVKRARRYQNEKAVEPASS